MLWRRKNCRENRLGGKIFRNPRNSTTTRRTRTWTATITSGKVSSNVKKKSGRKWIFTWMDSWLETMFISGLKLNYVAMFLDYTFMSYNYDSCKNAGFISHFSTSLLYLKVSLKLIFNQANTKKYFQLIFLIDDNDF